MISGVLHLTRKTKYGLTSRNVPIYLFRPFDPKQPLFVVGCSQPDTSANLLALVEVADMTQRIPRANLIRVLGRCGDWKAEREAIHWTYQPIKQPKNIATIGLVEPTMAGRLDLRGFHTLHIDPPGCKDVDDCITFWNDACVLTIADVGGWVLQNPQLQSFAQNGQTLYDNGKAVRPMFPPELSEGLFSLLRGHDRYGVSIVYKRGKEPVMMKTCIRVTHSYTYEDATQLNTVREWAEYISGNSLGDDPHTWIEALMVAYNVFMANTLVACGHGIFRGHEKPDTQTMERYDVICPDATRLAERAALYQTYQDRTPHYGLDVDVYTHSTSPIRRWADVHNQMVLSSTTPPEMIDHLNLTSKYAKRHERDLFFLDQLQRPGAVTGVVLDVTNTKSKIWVFEWKRVVHVRNTEYEPGTRVTLSYYLDMNQPTWKTRMVIAASKDCLESRSHEQVVL
jgi:exoribonuclease R